MPAYIGGSRGYPTENQPLSYAQQYGQANPAGAPPTGIVGFGNYAPATGPTQTATIGGALPWGGGQGSVLGQTASPYSTPTSQSPAASGGASGANIIGGSLPWNGAGGNMFQGLSGDPATTLANLGSNYQNAYNAALGMNQSNYNNILAGYQQTAGNQAAGQQATQAGYGQLSHDVLGGIAGIGSDQLALINRNYAGQSGSADQNLINSGLGNSTVRSSVQRGIGLDQNLAQNNLANSIAQTKAGYQSQLGLAGLGYQGQSVRDNTGLATRQLDWMNSVNAGYPNAAMYGTLAQQAGAAIQSNANRAQIDRLAQNNQDAAALVRQQAVLGGSGGTAPSTGGRLPPSAVNFSGGGMGAPGMGTSATPWIGAGGQPISGYVGPGGGGGAMQNFNRGAPVGGGMLNSNSGTPFGAAATGSGMAAGYNPATGVTNLMGGGLAAGFGGGGQFGGYDPSSNPFGFGGDFTSTPQYDPFQNPFGFGGDYTTSYDPYAGSGQDFSNPQMTDPYADPGYYADPNAGGYDQQPGAADYAYGVGGNAFAGADMFGYGGEDDSYDWGDF